VLEQLDEDTLDDLYYGSDRNEMLHTLQPLYQAVFANTSAGVDEVLFNVIYYGSLECLVGAFVWFEERFYPHPLTPLMSVTYNIYLEVWNYFEERNQKLVEREFAQRRIEFASKDEDREHDIDAAPAEKTRVFRNGLNARNKVGWIFYDQQHRTDCITGISMRSLALVKKLFENNPQLTAANLLTIMDAVMNAYVGQPKPMEPETWKGWFPPKGIRWHARRGHNLLFFITNLHTIVKQLNMTTPIETFLRDVKNRENEHVEEVVAMAA
jgi:hypothetical protein